MGQRLPDVMATGTVHAGRCAANAASESAGLGRAATFALWWQASATKSVEATAIREIVDTIKG
jgi:hypothetical protein